MADADFFWDPMCPWAWITSRWVVEVAGLRDLDVEWRAIALRIVNEDKDYDKDFPPRYAEGHGLGLRLLKVAAAVRDGYGNDAVGALYTVLGQRIHVDDARDQLMSSDGVATVLEELDLPRHLAEAGDSDRWTAAVREDTAEGLRRAGGNVGTPIITFGPPDGPSFFGPVISRVPRGDEALDLWACVERIAHFPGFAELKRSARERPQTSS